ncbi:DUF3592 domain-containing protein [Imperialibacter roseus]|uniref:DUF3592 domain-containing protein n=1 Tax=Imperialibacter roseus TaxID=1324217 RepID=A0ABZ0IIJ5_9BACT|nr:DUF3592 domain-containing protein [Imperialibacter roseus]WOK04298.1 DUF3592 domain-containing protein [Imperialibacter roseus]
MFIELIILAVSFALLAGGALYWQKSYHLLNNGKKVESTIVGNHFEPSRQGGVYYPVVQFLTDKQESVTQQLTIGFKPKRAEGGKVDIIYDPDDPSNIEIDSTIMIEILPRLLVAIGLCSLIFGLLEILDITQILESIH